MPVITTAGETLKAQKEVASQPLIIDKFILANITGQNPLDPIDRAEGKPAAGDIVLEINVTQKGFLNPNAVIYSLVLGSNYGDFDFNWIGLYSSADDVVFAIDHIPTQQKIKTSGVSSGNNISRNFMTVYDGAAALTGINVTAETWQIDFTARLDGIDERERLSNLDVFGRQAFFDAAGTIIVNGANLDISAGICYIAGIRIDLPITSTTKPTDDADIYLDVHFPVVATSDRQPLVSVITSTAELSDYVLDGEQHWVEKIGSFTLAGEVVTDDRIKYGISKATETTPGIAEIATQAEVDLGADDERFVTSKKLTTYIQSHARRLGEAFWHQGETPPVGAMEYSGQILSRTTYPELWAELNNTDNNYTLVTQAEAATRPGCWHTGDGSTTFGAPMLLGDVVRVFDSSGLLDAARVLGSHQEDQSLHVDGVNFGGAETNTITIPENGSWSSRVRSGRSTDGNDSGVQFKMNAAETRMKNTAWMLCFWYQQPTAVEDIPPGLGLFVAVADFGVNGRVMTSPDGVNWTPQVAAEDNRWTSLAWSQSLGLFVAVSATNLVMTSPDGVNWTAQTSSSTDYWSSVVWSQELGIFAAVADDGNVMTSPDGINWTQQSSSSAGWKAVTWSPDLGLFVAVAEGAAMTSPDGINWTDRIIPSTDSWSSIAWSASLGLFVAVANSGSNGRKMTSPDGINWTQINPGWDDTYEESWTSIVWSQELSIFVAVADSGYTGRVMTSEDGANWTMRTASTTDNWSSVTWSASLGLFVAVAYFGANGRVMTSPDGINWTQQTASADNDWKSVVWVA